jgi:hypothetical protein
MIHHAQLPLGMGTLLCMFGHVWAADWAFDSADTGIKF